MTDEAKALVERLRLKSRDTRETSPATCDDAANLIETQARKIERLNEELRKATEAHWFYYGDDCSSDQCRFCIDECISEDFEWDNRQVGDHVLQISGARPVPDMWIALHYFTEEEKDERDDDEPYAYTVHSTYEAARAALGESHDNS